METFSSKDQKYLLQTIGYHEPNNGRELKEVKVFKDGNDISSVLSGNWNYINYRTDKYQFNSDNSEFVYISFEGHPKLIKTKDDKILDLPYQPLSTVRFIGNKFENNYLIEVYRDEIVLTDLVILKPKQIKINDLTTIEWVDFIDKETLRIKYSIPEYIGNEKIRGIKETLYNIV